jgi:hypothetical protein
MAQHPTSQSYAVGYQITYNIYSWKFNFMYLFIQQINTEIGYITIYDTVLKYKLTVITM